MTCSRCFPFPAILLFLLAAESLAAAPSFRCERVTADSIEALICEDPALAQLDNQLALVYAEASAKATNEHPPVLKAEQRGWIKGRDDCWKSEDQTQCIKAAYIQRTAELQARYQLVEIKARRRYVCENQSANEVIATYFATTPPTLIAERGDQVSLMYLQPSASGARYQGPNESLWEHQREATITWGYDTAAMRCMVYPMTVSE